uniref:Uncharacterized protein n=1 Tax=Oryza glaberrima TaxID=4538 RepID=I1NXP9_ORYGL
MPSPPTTPPGALTSAATVARPRRRRRPHRRRRPRRRRRRPRHQPIPGRLPRPSEREETRSAPPPPSLRPRGLAGSRSGDTTGI